MKWNKEDILRFKNEEEVRHFQSKNKGHVLKTLFYSSEGLYWWFKHKEVAEHFRLKAMDQKAFYI
jgi:hypothetical protein